MHGRPGVANATRKPRGLLRAWLRAAHVLQRGGARRGVLGSLQACDGRNGACRGGAPAMASLRGGSLAPAFHSVVGSTRPCLCSCECACVRVMYRDKEKGGALGLLGGETTTVAMASTYRRARQAWGLTMGLRWLEWRCSGEVWPCVILSCDLCVFNTKVFLSRSNARARYHVIIKQNKCS